MLHPSNLLVLAAGAILAPGRRTVAAALSSVGLRGAAGFTNYHRALNRSRRSGRAAARCLLGLLVAAFVPSGPVVVGVDETIERRWGAKIKARGIYRDPVRSSQGHFVKASGLRWISLMLLAPMPFAGRVWPSRLSGPGHAIERRDSNGRFALLSRKQTHAELGAV